MSTGVGLAEDLRAHLLPAREIEARERRERLSTGTVALDGLLGGGWPRGTLCELRGGRGQGRTAVMLSSLAAALRAGEAAALIDFSGNFDPAPAVRAGVVLDRLLWVRGTGRLPERRLIGAAEAIVSAGGFGLVALDFGEQTPSIPTAAWLRLRRLVTAPGTVVLVVTVRAPANLFGATSLCLEAGHPHFIEKSQERPAPGPALLCDVEVRARLVRAATGGGSLHGPTGEASSPHSLSPSAMPPRLTLIHRPA